MGSNFAGKFGKKERTRVKKEFWVEKREYCL